MKVELLPFGHRGEDRDTLWMFPLIRKRSTITEGLKLVQRSTERQPESGIQPNLIQGRFHFSFIKSSSQLSCYSTIRTCSSVPSLMSAGKQRTYNSKSFALKHLCSLGKQYFRLLAKRRPIIFHSIVSSDIKNSTMITNFSVEYTNTGQLKQLNDSIHSTPSFFVAWMRAQLPFLILICIPS